MVESAGDCVKLMETVGLVRVNEVPLTLEIVGTAGICVAGGYKTLEISVINCVVYP